VKGKLVSQLNISIENLPHRSRLSVFFRSLLTIPHFIVLGIWQIVVTIVTFAQWFIIIFTGKRNEGIWRMQSNWLNYACRVHGYSALLFDKFPAFGAEPGDEPFSYNFEYEQSARRLSNFFRFFLAIPAFIIAFFLLIGAEIVGIITWFVIVITGKHPQGMFGYSLKVLQYLGRLNAYTMYMTDDYPSTSA
jgi:uncharacterized membrane protein YhdT